MPDPTEKYALWTPGWYELDQTLVIGERQKFWFFHEPPAECNPFTQAVDLVFFNELDSTKNCEVRYAKVLEIKHPQLGSLLRVDTDGLDYIFFPVEGEEVVVNAEENPGSTYESNVLIEDWSILVSLSEVSEPVGEIA